MVRLMSVSRGAMGILPTGVALCLMAVLAGCDYGGPYPDAVAASQAESEATWATRAPITAGGKPYVLAVSPLREFAQIAPGAAGFAYSAAELEVAVAEQTGCAAMFQGGFLDRLDGFTPQTNLRPTQDQLPDFQRWRVDLSC